MFTYFAATSSGLQFEQVLINANHKELIGEEVGKHWKKLGSALGLSSGFLNNTEADHSGDCCERVQKVLEKWQQEKGSGATMEALKNALVSIKRTDVAEKLLGM